MPTDAETPGRVFGAGWEWETAECSWRELAERWQQRPASRRGASQRGGDRGALEAGGAGPREEVRTAERGGSRRALGAAAGWLPGFAGPGAGVGPVSMA